MALWVAVHSLKNLEQVEETVLNRPIYELVERTNYLYGRISDLAGNSLFESVRVTSVALVTTGTTAPIVGDFVYLDETQNKYAKAIASPSALDQFSAANSAYALGILLSISGSSGTVVLLGKLNLTTGTSPWNLSSMVPTGETFRNGPYYLSSVEPGKMTANPQGPAIYLGYVMENPSNPGYGGYIMLGPQYKDMKDAHTHRVYALYSQPGGTQYVSGPAPTDTHAVRGFDTVTAGDPGDHIPRLVLTGTWQGLTSTQYTVWLSNSNSPTENRAASSPPTSWDHYIHWSSSDPSEGSGVSRIWSYETQVPIGTKGVIANLENSTAADWDDPFTVAVADVDKRTWVVDVPEMTRGWLQRKYRQYFTGYPIVNNGFSFIVMGGPLTTTDARLWDTLTVKCAKLYSLDWTGNASAGETVTIGTTVLTFGTDVVIDVGDPDQTYLNLMEAIVDAAITGVDVCEDVDNARLIIAVPTAITVSDAVANATTTLVSAGAGDLSTGTGDLMVYDQYRKALIATDSYWDGPEYWTPVDLTNGLQLMAIPYNNAGVAATGSLIAVGDYWDATLADEAPGAYFAYAMGMHPALAAHYPPIPVDSGTLILNGVELDSYTLFPTNPTYRLSLYNIYWYSDDLGTVPWPRDWVDVNNPGSPAYAQNLAFHFIRMGIGNTGIVTSLRPAPDSPIRVLKCGTGEAGTVGDLALDLDLNLQDVNANLAGYQVFKGVSGSKLLRGPVVERIIPGPGITITQPAGVPNGQGAVTISSDSSAYGGEFEEVSLENAKQERIGMFPYIRLLGWTTGATNINSGFIAKFRVPHTLGYADVVPQFKVVVYMTVFGETSIAAAIGHKLYAGIDFEYSILPDFFPVSYGGSDTAAAWNSLDATLPDGLMTLASPIHADIPFGDVAALPNPIYKSYDPMLIHNNSTGELADTDRRIAQVLGNPFPNAPELAGWTLPADKAVVRPGSIVGIRVTRSAATAGLSEYTNPIGFINIRWRLISI
jgi:hypothetical protein